MAAIDSFEEPIILLAGGKDKEMRWENWARCVREQVRHVILFGALAETLREHLLAEENPNSRGPLRISQVETMAEAVDLAVETAVPGDVVLLSPGGTSFDAFTDFARRGEVFCQLVRQKSAQTLERVR